MRRHFYNRPIVCLVFGMVMGSMISGRALAQEGVTVKRELPATRLNAAPVIDGEIGDVCWGEAARADRFTDVLLGTPVADQTVVFAGYDDRNIYVAFHAYDRQPQGIVGRETKRGSFPRGDDFVGFQIDPFHTHKSADRSFFWVNPRGTQFAELAQGRATKLEWEGRWQAAARIGQDGWTAEMAIPWSILNYPAGGGPRRSASGRVCGINFVRFQQRTSTRSFWSNVGPQFAAELDGHWVGVQFPRFRPELSLLPYALSGWQAGRGMQARAGLDVREALTPSLTLVGTVNPDFATVEEAVEGIDFSYGERFVPDRRPFFLEGAATFRSEGETGLYLYTRRSERFDAGVKLYGKVTPQDTVGVLAALDLTRRADWVLRARHELGATSGMNVTLINRDDSLASNRVLALSQSVRRGFWEVDASWADSWVDGHGTGTAANLHFIYETPRWYAEVTPHHIQPGFRDDLGLIQFTGFRGVNSYLTYATEWRQGPFRRLAVDGGAFNSDDYEGQIFRRQRRLACELQTRGDLVVRAGWDGGRFESFDDSVFSVRLAGRVSDPFHTFGVRYSWGQRAGAPMTFLAPGITWRFGRKLTLGFASEILRHTEDRQQHVFTFNYDLSPRRGLAGRVVAETGGTNGYLSYRSSGYGGVESFVLLGDPNAKRFRRQLTFKVVWPM